ncbi:MAG: DinB family protein [Flavobacteriales bacterium]|jgi:hypothetical protein|nr:DinB family protein [Flavobacteriales bacterium]
MRRTFDTTTLINALQRELVAQSAHAAATRQLPAELILAHPQPGKWSVMEVVQHMNLSSGHYYRALRRIYDDPGVRLKRSDVFKSGPIGNFSVRAMTPRADGTIPMPMATLRMFDPARTSLVTAADQDQVWKTYTEMLDGFHAMLELARLRGLEGPRITSTLGPVIRFRIGDAFRFPIAHQTRHVLQIDRIVLKLGQATRS